MKRRRAVRVDADEEDAVEVVSSTKRQAMELGPSKTTARSGKLVWTLFVIDVAIIELKDAPKGQSPSKSNNMVSSSFFICLLISC